MSLNKFTNANDYLQKQYLNLGCNDIKCSTLEVEGNTVIGVNYGVYVPEITFITGGTSSDIEAVYTIIGNKTEAVLDCSVKFSADIDTSSILYLINIKLPDGMTNYNTTNCIATGGMTHILSPYNYYSFIEVAQVAGQNILTVILNTTTGTLFPIGGSKVATLNFKCSVVRV